MVGTTYDIITVGGGLGGSALAKVMAERGARVLVLEREEHFKDRVRGEWLAPWGVAEAQELGIYDLLCDTCGHKLPWFGMSIGSMPLEHRDFIATTPQQTPSLAFYHPEMQDMLLSAAAGAGAEVRRGAYVRALTPGTLPIVTVEQGSRTEELQARLVVGADGRASRVRKWAGFPTQHDPDHLLVSGVLFEDLPTIPDSVFYIVLNPGHSSVVLSPQGRGRVRAYLVSLTGTDSRLQGEGAIRRFIEESVKTGAPAEWYAGGRVNGPLATFDGADTWVEHPYRAGVVLIGDAAAASDPTWGQGLSLTVRDVRVLRDQLLTYEDWDVAGRAYAEAHDRYYGAVHAVDNWQAALFFATGPEAEVRRARAFPLIAQDATRGLDHNFSGPDLPVNETVRRRFFGEE